jgi:hypothetical protein
MGRVVDKAVAKRFRVRIWERGGGAVDREGVLMNRYQTVRMRENITLRVYA